jgi:hypothetical protein
VKEVVSADLGILPQFQGGSEGESIAGSVGGSGSENGDEEDVYVSDVLVCQHEGEIPIVTQEQAQNVLEIPRTHEATTTTLIRGVSSQRRDRKTVKYTRGVTQDPTLLAQEGRPKRSQNTTTYTEVEEHEGFLCSCKKKKCACR